MDEGGFILDYRTPPGSSLPETDRQMRVLEGILRSDPDIQAFTRRTGAELGFAATAQNSGDFTVLLNPAEPVLRVRIHRDRPRAPGRRGERAPAVRMEFVQLLQDLMGTRGWLLHRWSSSCSARTWAPRRRPRGGWPEAVAGVPGLVDLYDGIAGDDPEMRIDSIQCASPGWGRVGGRRERRREGALFGTEAGSGDGS